MSFNNDYRQILARRSASHAWIALHRLVEAYGRTFGLRFTVVFAELEAELGFRRTIESQWPTLATMQAGARWLRARREEMLARRAALVAERRAAKRAGRRVPVPADLRAIERQLGGGPPVPRVGVWGWRRRRERARASS